MSANRNAVAELLLREAESRRPNKRVEAREQAMTLLDALVAEAKREASEDTRLLDAWETAGNENRSVMRSVLGWKELPRA